MSSVHARPLCWVCLAFVAGVVLGRQIPDHFPIHASVAMAALGLCCVVLGSFRRFEKLRSPFAGMPTFGFLGLLTGHLAAAALPAPPAINDCFQGPSSLYLAEVSAPVTFQEDRTRMQIRLISTVEPGRTHPIGVDILLTVGRMRERSLPWLPGERFLARLTVRPLRGFSNPGGFDYVAYQVQKGIHGRAYLPDDRPLLRVRDPSAESVLGGLSPAGITAALDAFRQGARLWLKEHLSVDSADFYGALLLGYPLPSRWNDHLNRTGLSHLVSISGLHLGLVGIGVFWLACRALRWGATGLLQRLSDQEMARWPALLAVLFYASASGLAIPTWRSLIMFGLFTLAVLRFRLPDALSTLALAAAAILLAWPHAVGQVSFQLSFAAMIGIFIVYPKITSRVFENGSGLVMENQVLACLLRPFADAFWVSLAVNVMILPILIHHFHGLSLASFIANTLLVPPVGLLALPLGLAGLVLLTIQETLALGAFQVGSWVVEVFLWAILGFSSQSWAYFWVGTVSAAVMAAYYGGLFLLQARWPWRRRVGVVLALILLAATAQFLPSWAGNRHESGLLRLHVIDVGQGSSTLLRFPTGETMLVDGGGFHDDSFDVGRSTVAPFLWHAGIHHLDLVVLSHDHPDHRNGLKFILSHFSVGQFWETGLSSSREDGSALASIARKRRIPIQKASDIQGEHRLGGCTLSVLHPTMDFLKRSWDGEDLNNASIVLEVRCGSTRVILPGDIDQSVENILPFDTLDSARTILVAAHHGSDRSTGAMLLERLRPQAVIFSCGRDNPFGFPSPSALARCGERGIPVYRTDLQGAMELVSNGSEWTIKPWVIRESSYDRSTRRQTPSIAPPGPLSSGAPGRR